MKRFIVSILLIVICFLLQTTVFKGLAFGGIVPNLLIVLTASFGFMRGESTGLLIGFFSGLLADIFFGNVLGLNAMIYMYIGYTNGKFNRLFFPDDIKLPLLLIFLSDLAYGLLYYITLFLMRSRVQNYFYFIQKNHTEIVNKQRKTMLLYNQIILIKKKKKDSEQRSAKKFV